MVVGEGRNDAGTELVGLRMGQFQGRHPLQMVVQQPGVVNQGLQNQRLAAGHRAALAAHNWTGAELGARRLVGAAGEAGRGAGCGGKPAAAGRGTRGEAAG